MFMAIHTYSYIHQQKITLPETLIPSEYHVVKNRGVLGLEYYEDAFGTHPNDHEAHLVMFPSMMPVSRYEVVQLKKTLGDMMTHAGLDESDFHMDGPTQVRGHGANFSSRKRKLEIPSLAFIPFGHVLVPVVVRW